MTDLGVPAGGGVRVAVIDTDSGFLKVLDKRLDRLGWEHRTLSGPVPVEELVAMRLGALVIDLGVLGPNRKSTRLNSSHIQKSRMPSSA